MVPYEKASYSSFSLRNSQTIRSGFSGLYRCSLGMISVQILLQQINALSVTGIVACITSIF